MKNKYTCLLLAMLFLGGMAMAQVPVEVFFGNTRSTVDIMFFRYFKTTQTSNPTNSKWLFFNRNRAGIDYRMTHSNYLPQFGFTEAISYNHPKLKGLAPVAVAQVLNTGVYAKLGLQYAHIHKDITLFTWLVCQTTGSTSFDYFLLFRYTPKLNEKLKVFTQAESINVFPTQKETAYTFTQRLRLGIQKAGYQVGLGTDISFIGYSSFTHSVNTGIFLRNEF